MTVGDGQPFEFPRAVRQSEEITRYATNICGTKRNGFTFPDAGPQDVPVVDVHHNPLAVQWIFVNGAER